jgi:dTDP-4-dehydrorhamnose 3,5-epimerase
MKKIETSISGLYILETVDFQDERGCFQKLYNYDFFKENDLDTDFKEFYYSVSRKDVIRGMHFQLPPFDHTKLVYVSKGKIRDVVVDLRQKSATFGMFFSLEMDERAARYLYSTGGSPWFSGLGRGKYCQLCPDILLCKGSGLRDRLGFFRLRLGDTATDCVRAGSDF